MGRHRSPVRRSARFALAIAVFVLALMPATAAFATVVDPSISHSEDKVVKVDSGGGGGEPSQGGGSDASTWLIVGGVVAAVVVVGKVVSS
jgi:hypothetical protein